MQKSQMICISEMKPMPLRLQVLCEGQRSAWAVAAGANDVEARLPVSVVQGTQTRL